MKRTNIQILRVPCVIVVVLFHTMTRYSNHPLIETQSPIWFKSILGMGVWIAVPMFLFISGFLFTSQLKRDRYRSWAALLYEKAKHLLIPYGIFTILIMLTSGFFDVYELVRGGFWHLWFLPTLFCCFAVFFPIFYSTRSVVLEAVVLIICYSLTFINIPQEYCFLGYDGMLKWGFYFVLGILIGNHERYFRHIMSRYHLWILFIALWVIDNIFTSTPYMIVSWHNTLCIGCTIVAFFYLSDKLRIHGKFLRFVELFSSASMGIYIFHYWILIYATSSTAFRLLGVFQPVNRIYVIGILTVIAAIVIILSYFFTRLLQSNWITKAVIG